MIFYYNHCYIYQLTTEAMNTINETAKSWDGMLKCESSSLLGRVADLEERLLIQRKEIVCLRATLSDALLRISHLESQIFLDNESIKKRNEKGMPSPYRNDTFPLKGQRSTDTLIKDNNLRRSNLLPMSESLRDDFSKPSVEQRYINHSVSSQIPQRSPVSNRSSKNALITAKRWSSTGDFTNFLSSQGNSINPASSKTLRMQYNEEEGFIHMYLHSRSVNLSVPSGILKGYDPDAVCAPPQNKLKLDWVYGYRGKDCRNNLHLLPTGEIIYFVASIAVLYNVEEHSQRHYLGHSDEIKCMAVHPNKLLIATGQKSRREQKDSGAHIRIWNSVSLSTLHTVHHSKFNGSIFCLSFSKMDGGSFLAAVGGSIDHNIFIWDWQKEENGVQVAESKCSVDTVLCIEWHPLDRNQIVSCGKGHVSFWSLNNSGGLYKRIGTFDGREKPRYVTCITFNQNGDVLTGDSNGNVIIWARGTNTICTLIKNVHKGSIFSICILKDGNIISGGGKDGRIVLLDSHLNPSGLEIQIEYHLGGIRTLSEGKGTQLLVGTTRNCILIGDLEIGLSPAMLGHTEEVWGLAAHPTLTHFATAGYDRLLQMWDSLNHAIVWSKDIGEKAQSICFSPDGFIVIVGCTTGKWFAIDSETREYYSCYSDGSEALQVIKFSPDGRLLALGSKDNSIYMYQVHENSSKYRRVGRCMGHSSYITHLDWSVQGQYLRSNSADYELLHWNAVTCRKIAEGSLIKDIVWASHSCIIAFETIGIWSGATNGVHITSCIDSADRKLLATGDDLGRIKLFSFPANQPKCLYHNYTGHSNHVTNIAFLQDNHRLISSGGSDTSVLQWLIN